MINNSLGIASALVALSALAIGCQPKPRHPGTFQGVIEFDERDLGFEVGGRLTAVKVQRGESVRVGQELARLDDTLERTAGNGRQAEVSAAKAAVALVRAGSRPEEVRSMQAQIRAAQANEARLERSVAREKRLLQEAAVAQASVDDLESMLHAATAERQALEQRLIELQNGSRRQEIDRAEAQASIADQQVRLSEERVGRYALKALEDGVVLDVHAEPGEVVTAGTPICTVADTKHPYADIFVPQEELAGWHVSAPVR